MPANAHPSPTATPPALRLTRRRVAALLVIALLAAAPRAQTEQESKRASAGALVGEARALGEQGSKASLDAALVKLDQALTIYISLGDEAGEANALVHAGWVCIKTGERQRAFDYLERSASLFHKTGDAGGEASALGNIGSLYEISNEPRKVLEYFGRALPLARASGHADVVVRSLTSLGVAYQALGDRRKAAEYYEQAITGLLSTGRRAEAAWTASTLGVVYTELGERQKALDAAVRSLKLYQEFQDYGATAVAYLNVGSTYFGVSQWLPALDAYTEALALAPAAPDARSFEVNVLSGLGATHDALGNHDKALEFFGRALALQRADGNRAGEVTTLINMGTTLAKAGRRQEATGRYNEALSVSRAVPDRAGEARTLYAIGAMLEAAGEGEQTLDYYKRALAAARASGERSTEAKALAGMGGAYYILKQMHRAAEQYELSLPIRAELNDREGEATTLINFCSTRGALGETEQAVELCERAVTIANALGDPGIQSKALRSAGATHEALGAQRKALERYEQALPLYAAVQDRAGEAAVRVGLGGVYNSLGEYPKALEYYEPALAYFRQHGKGADVYATQANVAYVRLSLGELRRAREEFELSLEMARAAADRTSQARMLGGLARVFYTLGERQKALDYNRDALALQRAVGDRSGEATTVSNMGSLFQSLGELELALDYYTQSMRAFEVIGNRLGVGAALVNIGTVHADRGDGVKALGYFERGLEHMRAVEYRQGEAATLSNIASVYDGRGERLKALEYLTRSLELCRAVGVRRDEAVALSKIGSAYEGLGDREKARDYHSQGLKLSREVGDRLSEANHLFNLARVARDGDDLREALSLIEESLDIIETLRTKVASQELRASYFATVQGFYEFDIDVLMRLHAREPQAGHDGRALYVSERGRARSLLELLTESGADIREGVDAELVGRERDLQQQLNASARRQTLLLSGLYTKGAADTLAAEIERLTNELRDVRVQIRQKSPAYAALTQPRPLGLREIQEGLLDKDTLLLEYALGTSRSYVWAVTPDSVTTYELPGRAEVEALAREFYRLVVPSDTQEPSGASRVRDHATRRKRSAELAARLSHMLLGPVAPLLAGKRLLVVGDGALQYVPFAALPEPAGGTSAPPLIVGHEIVSLPSASTLAVQRQSGEVAQATRTLAVLADPVFSRDDGRIAARARRPTTPKPCGDESREARTVVATASRQTGAGLCIRRLPNTRREAEELVKLVAPGQFKLALDFEANREIATNEELRSYRYVHFATHGFLNDNHPAELSGIVLSLFDRDGRSQDGFLRVHEIFNLKLAADVVVLSGCKTGLGQDSRGEGLVGLTRGFMYAGARRVVTSLWDVDDAATAEIMARFYRGMLSESLRPAQALRAAQVSMLNDRRYGDPFYWAAFTIQGDWR